MIQLQGRLIVVERNGMHGRFCVGTLVTDIGEFSVKDAVLDQFQEGSYAGRFTIERIFAHSYTYKNRLTIEVRAKIADLTLDEDGIAQGKVESPPPAEQDPIEEASMPAAEPVQTDTLTMGVGLPVQGETTDPVQQFFSDEQWTLLKARQPISLDPTIDRAVLRKQIEALNTSLAYRWAASDRKWLPK